MESFSCSFTSIYFLSYNNSFSDNTYKLQLLLIGTVQKSIEIAISDLKFHFIAQMVFQFSNLLSRLLSSILTTVKTNLQWYRDAFISRSGVNQMLIFRNWKDITTYASGLRHLTSLPYIPPFHMWNQNLE